MLDFDFLTKVKALHFFGGGGVLWVNLLSTPISCILCYYTLQFVVCIVLLILTFDLHLYVVKMPNQSRIFHFPTNLKSKYHKSDMLQHK